MERVAPSALNYDNILPLAIESRSNRREFRPTNGATFSNGTGATHIRIDVNADSMLDALNSYLSVDITNTSVADGAAAATLLGLAPFGPAFIQRLRIESGGVVIEDIDEYSRLFAMTSLCQCPAEYLKNNYKNMGMYQSHDTTSFSAAAATTLAGRATLTGHAAPLLGADSSTALGSNVDELQYCRTMSSVLAGAGNTGVAVVDAAANRPTAHGLWNSAKIGAAQVKTLNIPLMSGFLNMDKYIPLIMMNAGFTIDIEIVSNAKIGTYTTEGAAAGVIAVANTGTYTVSNVKYVAHLIDLDRSFYDKLRSVMEGSGGVLQMAGQTYRHYVGQLPIGVGPHTITLPARVKSVKSIFATFHRNSHYGVDAGGYSQSVFQNANMDNFRFEIGSVRYPQNDINCKVNAVLDGTYQSAAPEFVTELQKAFGKLGDYQHQLAFNTKNLKNVQTPKQGLNNADSVVDAYVLGYDFEAFQRVALEAGINTADRSLPINFICSKGATGAATRADFYVLTDAIYYINLDGTVSVSV